MDERELMKWAVKGLSAEIERLDGKIRKGREYVRRIDAGEPVKTSASRESIISTIRESSEEMERLDKERSELRWKLDVE